MVSVVDISAWVNDESVVISPTDNITYKQAVHTILKAIAIDQELSEGMSMKGGTLLGLIFKSPRQTTDIDFSTNEKISDERKDQFLEILKESLDLAEADLPYAVCCRIQSSTVQPKGPDKTYPTLQIKIGYAKRGSPAYKRLENNQSPKTIKIDYSFNERLCFIDSFSIDKDKTEIIRFYSVVDLLAEKIRSLLQQVPRSRNRQQDVFDINYILNTINENIINDEFKKNVLNSLISKSEGRNLDELLNKYGIDNIEIYERAKLNYHFLTDDLPSDVELPDFDESFNKIKSFYHSLPWSSIADKE